MENHLSAVFIPFPRSPPSSLREIDPHLGNHLSAVFIPFPRSPPSSLRELTLAPWRTQRYQRFLTLLKNVRVLYHHNQRARARPTGARTCRRPPPRPPHVCDRTVVAGRRRRRGVDEANLSRPRSLAKPNVLAMPKATSHCLMTGGS